MTSTAQLAHVLWVGGPPGAGKTTVATRLARRHGLRIYSADTRTWQHRDRAVQAGHPLARRWDALAPAQRWQGWSPQELFDLSLHAERGPMVVDDLRRLPTAPLVVAEGSTIPSDLVESGVADPARTVWLLPTEEFQRRAIDAAGVGPDAVALYRLLRQDAERQVAEHDLPTVAVDGRHGVLETLRLVEARFARFLAAGPCATTSAERRGLLREANQARADQVRGFWARQPAADRPDPGAVTAAFLCECGDPSCEAELRAGLAALGPAVLVAVGHGRPGSTSPSPT